LILFSVTAKAHFPSWLFAIRVNFEFIFNIATTGEDNLGDDLKLALSCIISPTRGCGVKVTVTVCVRVEVGARVVVGVIVAVGGSVSICACTGNSVDVEEINSEGVGDFVAMDLLTPTVGELVAPKLTITPVSEKNNPRLTINKRSVRLFEIDNISALMALLSCFQTGMTNKTASRRQKMAKNSRKIPAPVEWKIITAPLAPLTKKTNIKSNEQRISAVLFLSLITVPLIKDFQKS